MEDNIFAHGLFLPEHFVYLGYLGEKYKHIFYLNYQREEGLGLNFLSRKAACSGDSKNE